MTRTINFGTFQKVPAIKSRDEEGELDKIFLVDEVSEIAVKKFIEYCANLQNRGVKLDFKA